MENFRVKCIYIVFDIDFIFLFLLTLVAILILYTKAGSLKPVGIFIFNNKLSRVVCEAK